MAQSLSRPQGRLGDVTILGVVAFAVLVAVANTSAAAVAQPAIGTAFDAGPGDVGWVVFGYTISFAVSTAMYGRAAERFGIGRTLSFGIATLAVGSLVAVVAPSLSVLIAARFLQGAGAGAIPTLSVTTVASRFPPEKRALGFGVITGAVGAAQALGPILGGLLVEFAGWRAAVALGLLAAPIALVVWFDRPDRGQRAGSNDVVGASLVGITVGAFVYVVNRVPIVGATPVTLIAAFLVILGGWATLRRTRREGSFVPRAVVADAGFLATGAAGFLGSAVYLGTIVGLPSALAEHHVIGAMGIGLVLAPIAMSVAIASTANGWVQRRLGREGVTVVSQILLVVGACALASFGMDRPVEQVAVLGMPLGMGFGLLAPPLIGAVSSRFSGSRQPVAIGLFYLLFFLGGAVGAAVTTGFIERGVSFPGIESGMAAAEVVLAAAAVVGLVVAWHRQRRALEGGMAGGW